MSDSSDYTVGWICAIEPEYLAATLCLDEEHPDLTYREPNDTNTYTLGKINNHNVVIACLPDGSYGTSSAANVATNMMRSFPNIRIGLMVGIGGGAPTSNRDIRLGDIVVSSPENGRGGVLPYTAGKNIQEQDFKITGFVNRPPMTLLTAVAKLKTEYKRRRISLEKTIISILEKEDEELQAELNRPDDSTDILYGSNFVHSNDDQKRWEPRNMDSETLVPRPKRIKRPLSPVVHYGLIASGDQLMKDALYRDELARKWDVLCFEMEAAGLMNSFPCLIVRGICDYSDSHKTKTWQSYAALSASAYAKDLLHQISPELLKGEQRIIDILSGVQQGVHTLVKYQHSQEQQEIINWLSEIDYAATQTDHFARREPGTGQWFLNSKEYNVWRGTDKQVLFCQGIPGAGKTIITAMIIDDLYARFRNDAAIGIGYLYCDFRQQQTVEKLLLSLVKQLCQKQTLVPNVVKEVYFQYKRQTKQPPLSEISQLFSCVCKLYSKVFIVIDALDECHDADKCRSTLLSTVFGFKESLALNIFATSRFIPEIETHFQECVSLEIRANDDDVQSYLASHMSRLPRFVHDDSNLQRRIGDKISKSVDGMFLLASLHIDLLANEPTVGHLEQALENLPEKLDNMYEEAMKRIENLGQSSEKLAKKILSWIVNTQSLLRVTQLREAVAVEQGHVELNRKFMPTLETIGSICAGLVTIDTQGNVVCLVHYTTQTYFEETQDRWFKRAQRDITATCVTYLSFKCFEKGPCHINAAYDERNWSWPLYEYAARNWGHHARKALPLCNQDIGLLLEFLGKDTIVQASTQGLMYGEPPPWHYKPSFTNKCETFRFSSQYHTPRGMGRMHLVAYFGIEQLANELTRYEKELDLKDNMDRTPLSYAVEEGWFSLVNLLLETGRVDCDSNDWNNRTPLSYAAEKGHRDIACLLIKVGRVEINSKDVDNTTPLSYAAEEGKSDIVDLFLKSGKCNLNSNNILKRTPLSYAAENGHRDVVHLFLKSGECDLDSEDIFNLTPVSYAAKNGHHDVVNLFLESGKYDLDSKDLYNRTPLSHAAEKGYDDIVHLLLKSGKVDVDSEAANHRTPLSYAAENGHCNIARLLLKSGEVNVDSIDQNRMTPLLYAVKKGRSSMVRLLVDAGKVDPDSTNESDYPRTPLSYVVEERHEDILQMLLSTGKINLDQKDELGCMIMPYMVQGGHKTTVELDIN